MTTFRYVYLTILGLISLYSFNTIRKGNSLIKIYVIITSIVESVGFTYLYFKKTPLFIIYNLFSIFEVVVWLVFYFIYNLKKPNISIYSIFFIEIFAFFWLGDFNVLKSNFYGVLLNNTIVTLLILKTYFLTIKLNRDIDGGFWIFTGGLFYFLGGFLLLGLTIAISKVNSTLGSQLYDINSILNIFFYSIVFYGLYKINEKFDEKLLVNS